MKPAAAQGENFSENYGMRSLFILVVVVSFLFLTIFLIRELGFHSYTNKTSVTYPNPELKAL